MRKHGRSGSQGERPRKADLLKPWVADLQSSRIMRKSAAVVLAAQPATLVLELEHTNHSCPSSSLGVRGIPQLFLGFLQKLVHCWWHDLDNVLQRQALPHSVSHPHPLIPASWHHLPNKPPAPKSLGSALGKTDVVTASGDWSFSLILRVPLAWRARVGGGQSEEAALCVHSATTPTSSSLQEADHFRSQSDLWLNAVQLPVDREAPVWCVWVECRAESHGSLPAWSWGKVSLSLRGIVQSSPQGTPDGRMDTWWDGTVRDRER